MNERTADDEHEAGGHKHKRSCDKEKREKRGTLN